MVSEAPPFWWHKAGWQAWALTPFSLPYGWITGRWMREGRREAVPVPVICVGNFTVGGAGKTPTAIAIARAAAARGLMPGFLSRGYGGSLDRTVQVDADRHRAVDVGDEPLLLVREAITVVCRRRVEGARRLVKAGVDLIIMDDGFQSARLALDYALVVIDSMRGIGNGHLVPGGPVRAPLAEQMRQLSAILKVGRGDAADGLVRSAARSEKPVFVATVSPRPAPGLAEKRLLAFAGIADPDKFYRTVEELGGEIVLKRSFPDHHYFGEDEIAALMAEAEGGDLLPVTTPKDAVRLNGQTGLARKLLWGSRIVEVDMAFDDPAATAIIIDTAIENCRARCMGEVAAAK